MSFSGQTFGGSGGTAGHRRGTPESGDSRRSRFVGWQDIPVFYTNSNDRANEDLMQIFPDAIGLDA